MFVLTREPAFQSCAMQRTLLASVDLRNIRASRKGPSPSPWTSSEEPVPLPLPSLQHEQQEQERVGHVWEPDYARPPPQAARGTEMSSLQWKTVSGGDGRKYFKIRDSSLIMNKMYSKNLNEKKIAGKFIQLGQDSNKASSKGDLTQNSWGGRWTVRRKKLNHLILSLRNKWTSL